MPSSATWGLLRMDRRPVPQWISATFVGRMHANRPDIAEKLPRVFHMYRREPRHQLSFKDFFLPFCGKLSGENRWIKLTELIPGTIWRTTTHHNSARGLERQPSHSEWRSGH